MNSVVLQISNHLNKYDKSDDDSGTAALLLFYEIAKRLESVSVLLNGQDRLERLILDRINLLADELNLYFELLNKSENFPSIDSSEYIKSKELYNDCLTVLEHRQNNFRSNQ